MTALPSMARGREYYVYDVDPRTAKPVKVGEARLVVVWNRVYMTLTRTMNRKYKEYERPILFRYRGLVVNRQFVLTFRQQSMKSRAGACVLRSDSEGLLLSGQALYFDDDDARYINMELHLKSTASHRPSRYTEQSSAPTP